MAKKPRDATTVVNLATQVFPSKTSYVSEAYADATRELHSFALVDATQQTPDNRRIIGNFALRDRHMMVYVPRWEGIKTLARDEVTLSGQMRSECQQQREWRVTSR